MPFFFYLISNQCQPESFKFVTNLAKLGSQNAGHDELPTRFEAGLNLFRLAPQQIRREISANHVPSPPAAHGQPRQILPAGPDAVLHAVPAGIRAADRPTSR